MIALLIFHSGDSVQSVTPSGRVPVSPSEKRIALVFRRAFVFMWLFLSGGAVSKCICLISSATKASVYSTKNREKTFSATFEDLAVFSRTIFSVMLAAAADNGETTELLPDLMPLCTVAFVAAASACGADNSVVVRGLQDELGSAVT